MKIHEYMGKVNAICTRLKNKPLTLDELRGMDGGPVWIEEATGGHWELSADAADYFEDRDMDFYGMTCCGPKSGFGWRAYRYKPTVPKKRKRKGRIIMKKKGWIKCKVCDKHFKPEPAKLYLAKEEISMFMRLQGTGGDTYECYDCPSCGCQNVLTIRHEPVVESTGGMAGRD